MGLHISILVTIFLLKYVKDMIEDGNVSVIVPPLYGAIKGKTFIPLYNINDTEVYKTKGFTINRFKGLGEMNGDQLEVVIRSGIEYIINYPGEEQVQKILKNVVNNTEVRKSLLEVKKLKFDLILDLAKKNQVNQ